MEIGFEYTLQNKKIDFTNIEVAEINDYSCPHCGNDEIEFDGDRTFGSNEASQEVYCVVCECHWYNVYKFNEVQILN
jgi:Zn finger protein HypA/HybF involved in hydrogenase expression